MTNIPALIQMLAECGVEFIVIGGVAGVAHGAARGTFDLDVVYRRTQENIERLAKCLSSYSPYLRNAPPNLPFKFDPPTIRSGLNFTLDTDLGALDLLGEVAGGGSYDDLVPHSIQTRVFGHSCLCVGLKKLIQLKMSAGRRKDVEAIAELEALLEESDRNRE
jgi:predicted nucleotidyltransferase